jgi:hypothetical protein
MGEESVRRFFEDCLPSQIALDPNEHKTTARSKPCMKMDASLSRPHTRRGVRCVLFASFSWGTRVLELTLLYSPCHAVRLGLLR